MERNLSIDLQVTSKILAEIHSELNNQIPLLKSDSGGICNLTRVQQSEYRMVNFANILKIKIKNKKPLKDVINF